MNSIPVPDARQDPVRARPGFRRHPGQLGERDPEGCGDGHGDGEQGLLLAGLVPADLPRVHSGGLRQADLGHPEFRPAQADGFTQVHDPFNTSGEHRSHCDRGQTGRRAARSNGLW